MIFFRFLLSCALPPLAAFLLLMLLLPFCSATAYYHTEDDDIMIMFLAKSTRTHTHIFCEYSVRVNQ